MRITPSARAFVDRIVQFFEGVTALVKRVGVVQIGDNATERTSAARRHIDAAIAAPADNVDEHELPHIAASECRDGATAGGLLGRQHNSQRVSIERLAVGQCLLQHLAVEDTCVAIQRCARTQSIIASSGLAIGNDETQGSLWWIKVKNRHDLTLTGGYDNVAQNESTETARRSLGA